MTTCPWCGTNYEMFQPSCENCGGALSLPAAGPPTAVTTSLRVPPLAPRGLPRNHIRRILIADGWTIAAAIFVLLGAIFGLVGVVLMATIVAAIIGLPFAGVGALFLASGVPILIWWFGEARQNAEVLREGEAVLGEIVSVSQNRYVRVNGRHPWRITYRFEAQGQACEGRISTLSRPDLSQQPGHPIYVLFSRVDPGRNIIYPFPYGYHEM